MNNVEFNTIVDRFFAFQQKMEATKGKEYAGDTDRLANFKEEAADIGVMPETVCHIFLNKHLRSIRSYVKTVQATGQPPTNQSEPFEGRVGDAIVYLMLLYALTVEREQITNEIAAGDRGG